MGKWVELKNFVGRLKREAEKIAGPIDLGRVLIEMLDPGATPPWTTESGAYIERYTRVHMALRTNPATLMVSRHRSGEPGGRVGDGGQRPRALHRDQHGPAPARPPRIGLETRRRLMAEEVEYVAACSLWLEDRIEGGHGITAVKSDCEHVLRITGDVDVPGSQVR